MLPGLSVLSASAQTLMVCPSGRYKPAEHCIPDVSATPDVEASCITSCRSRRVLFSERRCGVVVCLQSRRRQLVLHLFHDFSFGSDARRAVERHVTGAPIVDRAVEMETFLHGTARQ